MDVAPFHSELLAMIDAEDFTGVKRKVFTDLAKQGVVPSDEFLDEGVLALKQYYVVALLDPTNRHAVSDVIDPFWHAHILHTKPYIDFCDRVFGQYIQHEPLDHSDAAMLRRVSILYSYTAGIYQRMFSYVNPEFYPLAVPDARLMCTHTEVWRPDIRDQAIFPRDEELAKV
ncbi:hypothetical protein I6A60_07180 [Frankia sp. AgB1.9]|uniref:hypothetical protein n=1 Tax=unclassified Frankia TaxID=2632575 RepID=UPI0019337909|nr:MULTISPECIES: hypothetical protein [unclassified Frankia]MBL7488396.1 hypothetical protein [Frankia sp. AgW1.1]MBL7547656.1 hypothetical protein [Frankia sp. AgB1.9]MBL7622455.1 hypothetical protein [Frankia sp. AgB1.8]